MAEYGLVFEARAVTQDDDERALLATRLERELEKRDCEGVITTISDIALGARFDVNADSFLSAMAVGYVLFSEATRTLGLDPTKIVFAEFNLLTEGDDDAE